jgi:hypothetical protein
VKAAPPRTWFLAGSPATQPLRCGTSTSGTSRRTSPGTPARCLVYLIYIFLLNSLFIFVAPIPPDRPNPLPDRVRPVFHADAPGVRDCRPGRCLVADWNYFGLNISYPDYLVCAVGRSARVYARFHQQRTRCVAGEIVRVGYRIPKVVRISVPGSPSLAHSVLRAPLRDAHSRHPGPGHLRSHGGSVENLMPWVLGWLGGGYPIPAPPTDRVRAGLTPCAARRRPGARPRRGQTPRRSGPP